MRNLMSPVGITCLLIGALIGLGGYTFIYAKGASYLSDDPNACTNCHVMRDQLDSWSKSTHHHVAICNDCHLPHNPIGKYAVKALNGFNHSVAFTLQNFKEPIRAKDFSREIAKNSCQTCHEPMIQAMGHPNVNDVDTKNDLNCLNCHRGVGHAR